MSVPKLPINPHWVSYTLTPYLRHVFSQTQYTDQAIQTFISRAHEFSLTKPDFPTDGDDLLFERIYLALFHKLNGIPAETNILTENLEPLARFLIRRAQLKGPFELLNRNCEPSASWKCFESGRREQLAAETVKSVDTRTRVDARQRAGGAVTKRRGSRKADSANVVKRAFVERCLDPRLTYAQPGRFTNPRLSGMLSVVEDQYYRQCNESIRAESATQQYFASLYRASHTARQYHPYSMSQVQQHAGSAPQAQFVRYPAPTLHLHDEMASSQVWQQAAFPSGGQACIDSNTAHHGPNDPAIWSQQQTKAPMAQTHTEDAYQQPFQGPYIHLPYHQQLGSTPSLYAPLAPTPISPVLTKPYVTLPNFPQAVPATQSALFPTPRAKTADWSDPNQRAESMAAFKRMTREEKIETLITAHNSLQNSLAGDVVGGAVKRGGEGNEARIVQSSETLHQGASFGRLVPDIGGFLEGPGYPNVGGSFWAGWSGVVSDGRSEGE